MHDPELEPRLMRLRVNAPRNINPLIIITIILGARALRAGLL